jgi:hypothetical protein
VDSCRFELLLVEIETGIVLDAQGGYWRRCFAPFRPVYASREEALAAKKELLRRFPFAEVVPTDRAGVHAPERFMDDAAFARYSTAMTSWRKWRHGLWLRRLFTPEPVNPRAQVVGPADGS